MDRNHNRVNIAHGYVMNNQACLLGGTRVVCGLGYPMNWLVVTYLQLLRNIPVNSRLRQHKGLGGITLAAGHGQVRQHR